MKILFLSLSFLLSNQLYSQLPKGLLSKLNDGTTTRNVKQRHTSKTSKAMSINFKERQKVNDKLLLKNNQKTNYKNRIQASKENNSNQKRKQAGKTHWVASYRKWLSKHSTPLKQSGR